MKNSYVVLTAGALLSVFSLRVAALGAGTEKKYVALAPVSKTVPKKTVSKASSKPTAQEIRAANEKAIHKFLDDRCLSCHDTETQKGGLDLEKLKFDLNEARTFEMWVKIHDKVRDGQMPPPKKEQPTPQERAAFKNRLAGALISAQNQT